MRPSPSGAPHRRVASVGARTSILLGCTVGTFAAILAVVHRSQSAQLDLLLRERGVEAGRVLDRILDLRASGARIHADDYTRWDDFVAFTRKPSPEWGRVNLTESIATFGLDAAWVLDDRFRVIFTANPAGNASFAQLPVPRPQLAARLAERPVRHFFALLPAGLLEIWTSSIQPSDDFGRRKAASGYYVAGRLWTPDRVAELSTVVGGAVRWTRPDAADATPFASAGTGDIRLVRTLPDLGGSPVAALIHETTYVVVPTLRDALRLSILLMVSASLVSFVAVAIALTQWVSRPLATITESLRTENPSLLDRTLRREDEFGGLAWLVREFFEQRRSLIEARQAAEAAACAKEQFLASISHDLRTPMHGVLSYARIGTQDAGSIPREELLDYFKSIDQCGTTLLALLDDLLDLAKMEAGRMTLAFQPMSIEDVVRDALGEFVTLYQEKKLTLGTEIEAGLPSLALDPLRIRQVLRNLLSNARKFTPQGGKVVIRVSRAASMVRVSVEDSGAGIPPGELSLVFERFAQASSNKPMTGGTGLGLALCREIVTAHGGRIWAETRASGGSTMTFELPIDRAKPRPGEKGDPSWESGSDRSAA